MWSRFFKIEYLVSYWWRLMVDLPLKSSGQQQSFWPWGNMITKNNGQFISGGKNKINLLSGFSCWSVLSNLLDSERTEVLRSMWYLFEGGKQSEEEELWFWQGFPLCSTCPGDRVQLCCSWWSIQDDASQTWWGPGCFFPAPGDGADSDTAQLYPGMRMLGQTWEVPPRHSLLPLDALEKRGIPAWLVADTLTEGNLEGAMTKGLNLKENTRSL